MANELISREALLAEYDRVHIGPPGGARKLMEDAPTVDAVEVVHGEWVVCGDGEYVPFMCSACGKTTSWYHAQTSNYCPNCGANMMDGDGNG